MVTSGIEMNIIKIILGIIIGVLLAVVYSLRVIVLMERKIARMDINLIRIVNKLYKVKKMLSVKYKEKGEEELDDMFLKEQSFSSFCEFYLLDFAAMFRAIELGLIKFKVSDFFKNYEIRRPG